MINRPPSPARASHAHSWVTWGLLLLLLVYFGMVWLLEGVNLRDWLAGLASLSPTAFIWEFVKLFWVIFRHFIRSKGNLHVLGLNGAAEEKNPRKRQNSRDSIPRTHNFCFQSKIPSIVNPN